VVGVGEGTTGAEKDGVIAAVSGVGKREVVIELAVFLSSRSLSNTGINPQ
jgi:hypothetical protein